MSPFTAPTGISLGLNGLTIPHIRFQGADEDQVSGDSVRQEIERGCEAIRLWAYEVARKARHQIDADLDPRGVAIVVGDTLADELLAPIMAAVELLPEVVDDIRENRIGAHEAGVRTGWAA